MRLHGQSIGDPEERDRVYRKHLTECEEQGKAINAASGFEIDDVIDRVWIRTRLSAVIGTLRPARSSDAAGRRIDTW